MASEFPVTRRTFLGGLSAASVAALPASTVAGAAPDGGGTPPPADVHFLTGPPPAGRETSFGVPWPAGSLSPDTDLALEAADGTPTSVQSWPLAYWPDGSVKWTGHAVNSRVTGERYALRPGTPAAPTTPARATRSGNEIRLRNGTVELRLPTRGNTLVRSFARGGRTTATDGTLLLRLRHDDPDSGRETDATGIIDNAEIEQDGPVRAVVRLSGHYRGTRSPRLPWSLRLYLAAEDTSVRLVHHFEWDGDETRTFVRGMGLRLSVPMADAAHNRHVRFGSADGGVFGEPVRVLTGLRRDPGAEVRRAQVDGTATSPPEQWYDEVREGYQQLARWQDYTLLQDSARRFGIRKRTSSAGAWLHAGSGERAGGFGFLGSPSGGLGFGISEFWQRFPSGFDIRGAAEDTATVTLWTHPPQAEPMDLRGYDTQPHGLDLAYEDVHPEEATAHGVSRATEMQLWAMDATPDRATVAALSSMLATPPRLVTTPRRYHAAGVFGHWSLPDRSTPARAELEDSIDRDVAFYAEQVDQRDWYGFWHHGDVMHTYDGDRHVWRYDVGGYAWDNAELGTDAALWYAFLRTGSPTAFHLAWAMTRHVAEVDTHHSGPFAGLGSRHAVVHWGGGAKEARVSESYTKRFGYYLTADELLGDLMRSSLQADETLLRVDPLRHVLPPQDAAPTRLRIGPDWYALVSNWLTEWERTGEPGWRDRIVTGMRSIAQFPAGLFTGESGGAVGFDPSTGELTDLHEGDFEGGYNLSMAFCGEQILWETLDLVDVPGFRRVLLDFARYGQAPPEEKKARYGRDFDPELFDTIYSRVTAWAGVQLDDPGLRRRGWRAFLDDPAGQPWPEPVRVEGTAVLEPVREIPLRAQSNSSGDFNSFSTNDAAQRILAIVSLLALAPGEAP